MLVHYELYDGIPLLAKWIEVRNRGRAPAPPEPVRRARSSPPSRRTASWAVRDPAEFTADPRSLHVETDYSFGDGMTARVAAAGVHWKADPLYATQVNYARQTPCLLETRPAIGPDQVIAPGGTLRVVPRRSMLLHDSTERERRGLALRRMYRTLAPWVHGEPDPDARPQRRPGGREARHRPVRGGRLRDGHPHLRQRLRHRERGPDVPGRNPRSWPTTRGRRASRSAATRSSPAGRSRRRTTSSTRRRARPGGFATFGDSPCLGSRWGQDYFRKLRQFFEHDRAGRARARRLLPGRRLRLDRRTRATAARRFAVDAVAGDHRLLPVVPRRTAST